MSARPLADRPGAQALHLAAAVSFEKVPSSQLEHEDEPSSAANRPGEHGVQTTCPAAPPVEVPMGHALQTLAAASDTKPAGHARHTTEPLRSEKRPASQAAHSCTESALFARPGGHSEQEVRF